MARTPGGGGRIETAYVVDAVVALVLLAVITVELVVQAEPETEPATALAFVLAAAFTLPYAVHRVWPVTALVVSCVAVVAYSAGHFAGYPGYALFALVFGLGLHGGSGAPFSRRSMLYFAGALAALSISLALQPAALVTLSTWISTVLVLAVSWLAGENLRARKDRWTELEDRARRLEAEREEQARQAVDAERMRIARELHDVVAHSMSVIAVQAGVANHVVDSKPEMARGALGAIETTSRSALVELRRMLGVLRESEQHDEDAVLVPCYCLADLEQMVGGLAGSGLEVELTITGDEGRVPEAVSLSAYRIAQEALTNVLRHGGSTATVDIRCGEAEVEVDVRDPGRPEGPTRHTGGSGHGLIGMRERVAIFGGRLQAGPDGAGFRVLATLPYAADAGAVAPDGDPATDTVA